MNRKGTRCIYFCKQGTNGVNCCWLRDPDDICMFDGECIRDKVKDQVDNSSTKKILKKYNK